MPEWWATLNFFMQFIRAIILLSGLIFIVQTVLIFFGYDSDVRINYDKKSKLWFFKPFLTFRNLNNFCLGFCLGVVFFYENTCTLLFSVLAGLFFTVSVLSVIKWIVYLRRINDKRIKVALGAGGQTYETIPAHQNGAGIVRVYVETDVREYLAQTADEEIEIGTPVRVIGLIDDNTVLVKADGVSV